MEFHWKPPVINNIFNWYPHVLTVLVSVTLASGKFVKFSCALLLNASFSIKAEGRGKRPKLLLGWNNTPFPWLKVLLKKNDVSPELPPCIL